jgi:hypothetical protein
MMHTRKPNKIHGQLPDDSDSVGMWCADTGWCARWQEHHAQRYTQQNHMVNHPHTQRKFLETVPVFFTAVTDTTNIAMRLYFVITESPDKPALVGVWFCTWQSLRRHFPNGNIKRGTTTLRFFYRYHAAVTFWVAEKSLVPFRRCA